MRSLTERERGNVAIVERLLAEVWSSGRPESVVELFAPDLVAHYEHVTVQGVAAHRLEFFDKAAAALSDLSVRIREVVANEDDIVVRWNATGIHAGTFFEARPANQPVNLAGMTWFRFDDGRIAELWMHCNASHLLHRLGAEIRDLRCFHSVCFHCKKVKPALGEWMSLEEFVETTTGHLASHGLCPDCFQTHYPDLWSEDSQED